MTSSEAHEYLDTARELLQERKVSTRGPAPDNACEAAELTTTRAESLLREELDLWIEAGLFGQPDEHTEPVELSEETKEAFIQAVSRVVQLLTVVNERAARKHLPLEPLVEKLERPGPEADNVIRLLMLQYADFFSEIKYEGEAELSPALLGSNLALYQTTETLMELRRSSRGFPDNVPGKLLISNPIEPAEALTRLRDNNEELKEIFPQIPAAIRLELAIQMPTDPVAAAQRLLRSFRALQPDFPSIPDSILLGICHKNSKHSRAAAEALEQSTADITDRFPEISRGAAQRIAGAYPENPIGAAEDIMKNLELLCQRYPGVSRELLRRGLVKTRRDAVPRIIAKLERVPAIQQQCPEFSEAACRRIAIDAMETDPLQAAKDIYTKYTVIRRETDLPKHAAQKLAARNGAVEDIITDIEGLLKALAEEYPDIPPSDRIDLAIKHADSFGAADTVRREVARLGQAHPKMHRTDRLRLAMSSIQKAAAEDNDG